MQTKTEAEFGATPNLELPNTPAEKKAVECFVALEAAERKNRDAGMEFGRAMIELREEIKSTGDRDFLKRLKQLGITHEKFRYWVAVVQGKPTDRRKDRPPTAREPGDDLVVAAASIHALADAICLVEQSQPVDPTLMEDIRKALAYLADALGYRLVPKEEENA